MPRKISYNNIAVNSETKAKIDALVKICKYKSKNQLLEKLIEPIFEVASTKKTCEIESYVLVGRSNVVFQLWGNENHVDLKGVNHV